MGIMAAQMPLTTTSLLLDALLEPANEAVWREFDSRYRPIIFACGRRLGLTEEGAADVAQQTLFEFVRDYRAGKYDRDRGRLRSWILTIARNRIVDRQRQQARQLRWAGESAIAVLPDGDSRLQEMWQQEHDRYVFEKALAELRETSRTHPVTLQAFELLVLQERPEQDVARQCNLSVAEVYRVKHRVTKRLREIVQRMNRTYDESE